MHRFFLYSIFMVFVMTSCGLTKKDPKEGQLPRSSFNPGIPSSGEGPLKIQAKALEKPNQYQVHLSWMGGSTTGDEWILQREQVSLSRVSALARVPIQTREYTDDTVLAGEKYRYYLYYARGSSQGLHAVMPIEVPKDLEIQGVIPLKSITGIKRLFLRRDSRIQIEGDRFDLEVDEILSDWGVIESFNRGQTATPEKDGRSGSPIFVKARKGSGDLIIRTAGERGGKGTKGIQGAPGERGKKGSDARCVTYKPNDPLNSCIQNPTDGERGGKGGRGFPGGRGRMGGNSSPALITVLESSPLRVQFQVEPGRGGLGGDGGDGGEGGAGGEPGSNLTCCNAKTVNGAKGETGEKGVTADEGEIGRAMPTCVKLADSRLGDCAYFTDK